MLQQGKNVICRSKKAIHKQQQNLFFPEIHILATIEFVHEIPRLHR
jgi:hypothetical protein